MYNLNVRFLFNNTDYKKIVFTNLLLMVAYTVGVHMMLTVLYIVDTWSMAGYNEGSRFIPFVVLLITTPILALHVAVLLIRSLAYFVNYFLNRTGKKDSLFLASIYLATMFVTVVGSILICLVVFLLIAAVFRYFSSL